MPDEQPPMPDDTAVRVALWRALHVEVDAPPHVFEDVVGAKLVASDEEWRSRPDMSPFTRPFRTSIVARARFVEDLVAEQAARGIGQYVILGAGLDTFAQRRPEVASRMPVFEIDRPGLRLGSGSASSTSASAFPRICGSCRRLRGRRRMVGASGGGGLRRRTLCGRGVHRCQHVPDRRRDRGHAASGRDAGGGLHARHVVHASDRARRPRRTSAIERAAAGAAANGTPFLSFFTPAEMLALARDAGFRDVQHVSAATLARRYFAGRTDGLRPPQNAEELLVATT